MKLHATIFGAGCIGRGMLGQSLCKSGFSLTFVEKIEPLVKSLDAAGRYPLRTVGPRGVEDMLVTDVHAIWNEAIEDVSREIADTDLIVTAVGVANLPDVADKLVQGLVLRSHGDRSPVNILVCENLMHANRVLQGLVRERFPAQRLRWFDGNVGFVEMVINRMVPKPDEASRRIDPLLIRIEPADALLADADTIVGTLPPIHHLTVCGNFEREISKKLFVHNMGHAVTAYFGWLHGAPTIHEAIRIAAVCDAARAAMRESAWALSRAYAFDMPMLEAYVEDLLERFANPALGDTVLRVGADPMRKLRQGDRFAGAAALCIAQGLFPDAILRGMAAGAVFATREGADAAAIAERIVAVGPVAFLRELTGLDEATAEVIARHAQEIAQGIAG